MLEEEGPATGPTQIDGNYVGLDATGGRRSPKRRTEFVLATPAK